MTFLSRIRINPLRAESRRLLTNPRAMHGAVMGGVPDVVDGDRVLWRLDADDSHRPYVYVLTPGKPDWTHVVERAGWPDADGDHALVRDYAPLLAQVSAGREFAFRLTANPVQTTRTPLAPSPAQKRRREAAAPGERIRGFRHAHRTAATQLEWFLTRTGKWGFEVPAARTEPAAPGVAVDAAVNQGQGRRPDPNPAREVRITGRSRHSFAKGGRGPHVVFHSATFEGRLKVVDPTAFATRLLRGIGPSKAYGCGLLTLAPLPAPGSAPAPAPSDPPVTPGSSPSPAGTPPR
ncbi:type I-E CRISPR-associated protein Cas6/Cse3/CasE [Streptomyces sp. NPDC047315]|uniref:type I-E CRISPR-associated protein Cas6/Cse3/CasE n=1 Tax=Streptomyces sp. NPDC047315 TaxID=3155142 RepID=UPI0033C46CE8